MNAIGRLAAATPWQPALAGTAATEARRTETPPADRFTPSEANPANSQKAIRNEARAIGKALPDATPQPSPVVMLDMGSQHTSLRADRLAAAVDRVLQENPAPSDKRDQMLLWSFLREATTARDLSPYLPLLRNPEARFNRFDSEPPTYAKLFYRYPDQTGKTADDIGRDLERLQPIYDKIRAFAKPLPPEMATVYRWGSAGNKADVLRRMGEDGRLDVNDLYEMRGVCSDALERRLAQSETAGDVHCTTPGGRFTSLQYLVQTHGDQAAIYAAEGENTTQCFGDTQQALKLSPGALFVDNHDPEFIYQFHKLARAAGVESDNPASMASAEWDLLYKAGIDVTRDEWVTACALDSRADKLREADPSLTPDQACKQAAVRLSDMVRGWESHKWLRIYTPDVIERID